MLEHSEPGAHRRRRHVFATLLLAFAATCAAQDSARSGPLYDELARMDGGLFEAAQFVHLWNRENADWRLARVLSFDHRPSGQPH